MMFESENFEVESRRIEYGIGIEIPEELSNEELTDINEPMDMEFEIPSCHQTVREGLPF